MPRSQCEKENIQLVQELAEVDGPFESPININFRDLVKLELPSLSWNKPDAVPKKMKVTNTGHTVIISGKWKCERPYLTGGPLDGKYVFSQIHFHWGPDNVKGSEHQVCGESFPLEMHVTHFKAEYMTQESALREKDGMVVLVYLFKLQEEPNNSLKKVISALPCVRQPNTCQQLESRSILSLCNPFTDDYFMYWGSVLTSTCAHILLWVVCREPFGISSCQVEEFRKILDTCQCPILRNNRDPQPLHKRNVFHVNASKHLDQPMLPIKKILGCFCNQTEEKDQNAKCGDGGCSCCPPSRIQEEFEGNKDCSSYNEKGRGNGVFLQQTVYYQHATVHSVSASPKRFPPDESPGKGMVEITKDESGKAENKVTQSCCFISIENEKGLSDGKRKRMKGREDKKPFDSVTTLVNLIDTLEAMKIQTCKKLRELESIKHEIRDMKSSCDNLEEKHWLSHAEKMLSRQKRFTIRSSQCCLSNLKKLAKEYNFDKLLEDEILLGADDEKSLVMGTGDRALARANESGSQMTLKELKQMEKKSLNFFNEERFNKKAQKLIRSFFEDIKETDEAQINLEKNLLLKKFAKISKKGTKSDQSNGSSFSIAPRTQMLITKNMMNLCQIREQFFTEIPNEDNKIAVRPVTKKKKASIFNVTWSGFENGHQNRTRSKQKTVLKKSAFDWLKGRFNYMNDTSPVIPLRITDIELKTGNIYGTVKKSSKETVKPAEMGKVASGEHIHTEVSSYVSESFISEFSEKSVISKDSKAKAKGIIREIQKAAEARKSEVSFMQMVKDVDTNSFFVHLGNSPNISSATTMDSDRKDTLSMKRKPRTELWDNTSSMSTFRRELSNKHNIYKLESTYQTEDVKCMNPISGMSGDFIDRRLTTSSDSSVVIASRSKNEIVQNTTVISCTTSESNAVELRDVCVDTTENKSTNDSPRRKKLKLEWKFYNFDVQPKERSTEVHSMSYMETECHKVTYVENECQADLLPTETKGENLIPFDKEVEKTTDSAEPETNNHPVPDNIDPFLENSLNLEPAESTKETIEQHLAHRPSTRDISVDANIILPVTTEYEIEKKTVEVSNQTSESLRLDVKGDSDPVSSPRKNSNISSKPSEVFSIEVKQQGSPVNREDACWLSGGAKPIESGSGTAPVAPVRLMSVISKSSESCQIRDVGITTPLSIVAQSKSSRIRTYSLSTYFNSSRHTLAEEKNVSLTYQKQVTELNSLVSADVLAVDSKSKPDKCQSVSRNLSQNELSECSEYDVYTDSNETPNNNELKKYVSRNSTASLLSSDEDKQAVAEGSPRIRLASDHNLSLFKNRKGLRRKKRRQCMRKRSKQLIRRNSAVIKKHSKTSGGSIDFTNLTEEEQLKIISANVVEFVNQKFIEHKQFLDLNKIEPITVKVAQWNSAEVDADEVGKTVCANNENVLEISAVDGPMVKEAEPAKEVDPRPEEVDENGKQDDIPAENVNHTETACERTVPDKAGKAVKSKELRPDFIKLNKMLAGKYKRRLPVENPRRNLKFPPRPVKEEKKHEKETAKPTPKPATAAKAEAKSSNNTNSPVKKPVKSLTERGERPLSADTYQPPGRILSPPAPEVPERTKTRIPTPTSLRNPSPTSPRFSSRYPNPPLGNQKLSNSRPSTPKSRTPCLKPTAPPSYQKANQQKKRLVPTYTFTSYLSPPNDVLDFTKPKLGKYLKKSEISEFVVGDNSSKDFGRPKRGDTLSKKNLDYLIMLQKRINHEITANIESSMNYVKTLLSQDYNGTAIIEKAPVRNSLDMFDSATGGIVLIEVNDQYECCSSGSEFSDESGFYCIYQNEHDSSYNITSEFTRGNESGDSGLVDLRNFEEIENDTDSSCNCEVSIVVNTKPHDYDAFDLGTGEHVPNVLDKYIYHLVGSEDLDYPSIDALPGWKLPAVKPKKRRETVLDIPQEMKKKLLDELEEEMKRGPEVIGNELRNNFSDTSVPQIAEYVCSQHEAPVSLEVMQGYTDECDGEDKYHGGSYNQADKKGKGSPQLPRRTNPNT